MIDPLAVVENLQFNQQFSNIYSIYTLQPKSEDIERPRMKQVASQILSSVVCFITKWLKFS